MGLIDKIRDFGSKIVKRVVGPSHRFMKILKPEHMKLSWVGGKGSPTKEQIEAAKNRHKNTILSSQSLGLTTSK